MSADYEIQEAGKDGVSAARFAVASWLFVIFGFLCVAGFGEHFYVSFSVNQGIGFILIGLFLISISIVHVAKIWLRILTLTIEASSETQVKDILEAIKSLGTGLD